jgi:hypothetical protein
VLPPRAPSQVAVVTKFPNLVDLQGRAAINQTDRDAIMGYTGARARAVCRCCAAPRGDGRNSGP